MTVKIHVFATRRSDFSPSEFRDYYENTHVPLISELLGDAAPLIYTRNYISRTEDSQQGYPADVLMGEGLDFDFDCIAESVFTDQAHLERCFTELNAPGKKEKRIEDEKKFLDIEKLKAVVVTTKNTFPPGSSEFVVKKT